MEYENNVTQSGQISLFNLIESASGAKLLAALDEARNEYKPLEKSGVNSYYKTGSKEHRFSTLKDIENAVELAHFTKNLHIRHQVIAVQTANGLQNALRTTLEHKESGEFISSIMAMDATSGPQGNGSQITYYRRYNLLALLNLEADDEDDGNAAQGNKGDKAAPQTKMPSRSYEVFGLDGKVARTFTDWNSFSKSIHPLDRYKHSDIWCKAQVQMLDEVRKWVNEQRKGQDEKVQKNLTKLHDAAQKLKGEIVEG